MASVTDLFCGAGGSSIGAELAGGTLRLGLNHWSRAVETHAANFADADHDCADASQTNPRRYPSTDILLASPECVNHSLAKGSRRRKPQAASLWEDGPAGDAEQERSRATMWDVVRFAEHHAYKAIVVENVVDAAKWGPDDNGQLFDAWLGAMRAIGYEHECVWLNSMFCPPTPQSRDRLYVVFWRRGMRRPNLRFEPPAWCPQCERIVEGRQRWKRPDARLWGRYGAQYLYACPDCHGVVLPGAFPAASAIDWSLPAQVIGERKRPLAVATRERIRRGLERLAREPFAIRLTHGGVPKPLTLPLVTQTRRHDMAMVMPVAGNTYERSPGNRARDAERQPLDTLHGTLERAMVVPPMGGVDPRDVDTRPAPTQTSTTRAALVTRTGHKSANGSLSRDPATDPAFGCTTQQDLALVYANRAHGRPRPASEHSAQSVCTGGHLGVVLRNNTARGDAGQMATPAHEPMRTLTAYGGRQSLVVPYSTRGEPKVAGQQPVDTLTTENKLALVVPAGGTWADSATPAAEPRPTQTSRESHGLAWGDEDVDACRFRMFALDEIAAAMVMGQHVDGAEYRVLGNKRERMAQYGNAVTPPAMTFLVTALLAVIDEA